MRRTVIAARSSAGPFVRAAVYQQHMPRRMFATGGTPGGTPPPSKSEPPTTPVDRSKEQAHPIGAYYEGVLNGSKNYPDTKPELPPVTSQKYPAKLKPAESEAKPEPEPSKPKQDDNVSSTPAPTTPSEPTPKKEGEQQQPPPVEQEKQKEEQTKKPASATTATSATTPADEPELDPAKKTDEKGGDAEAIIAKAVTPEPVPVKRAVRKPRELKKKIKDPKEAKEPKVVKSAQGTPPQTQGPDPTPASNPSGNLSGSDGSGTAPAPQSSSAKDEGEAGSTKIIFSASLASAAQRAERLASIRAQSKLVAGVLVPPRPEEPDNCCMSGCVNCVWDLYRDEMEAWATATAEAEQRLAAQNAGLGEEGAVAVTGAVEAGGSQQTPSSSSPTSKAAEQSVKKGTELGGTAHSVVDQRGAVSMDDDGGGSSSNWDFGTAQGPATGAAGASSGTKTSATDTTWNDDLYKNVPVGIREFMKQEKRLKEKHAREGTVG